MSRSSWAVLSISRPVFGEPCRCRHSYIGQISGPPEKVALRADGDVLMIALFLDWHSTRHMATRDNTGARLGAAARALLFIGMDASSCLGIRSHQRPSAAHGSLVRRHCVRDGEGPALGRPSSGYFGVRAFFLTRLSGNGRMTTGIFCLAQFAEWESDTTACVAPTCDNNGKAKRNHWFFVLCCAVELSA